ncbi:MAG: ferritin-like domain-containing protein [Myxococcales bacterium]|nr:ferritin-like domain-containing protein [Myxococcales bacterium]
MQVKFVDAPPTPVECLPIDPDSGAPYEPQLQPGDEAVIAEIFSTPLTGAYCWDYREADERIRKLYRLGKERNWNAEYDLDWGPTFPRSESPALPGTENPYEGWADFEALSEERKHDFDWHSNAWVLSQFLHGEQGALLVSSQLVSCAPTHDAKLYAASQTFDEARHVEVFGRYLRQKVGIVYPVNRHLKALLDKVLTDPRWDLKFIGMQLIIEALALAAFNVQREMAADPLLRNIIDLVIRDEARHVAFGVNYMQQFVATLSPGEVEERAVFAFEACRVMRERIVPTDVYTEFGLDEAEGRRRFLAAGQMDSFRNLLFMRIMPNLKRVGLLPPSVHSRFEELGLMQLADLPSDADIDWAQLSAPLPTVAQGAVAVEQVAQ